MGWCSGSIGNFRLLIHDSVYDYLKDKQPKEYYENFLVDAEFIHFLPGWKKPEHSWVARERNKEEWEIKIPLLKLGKIHKLKKNYRFEWDMKLTKIMWEEIKGRGFVVEGYPGVGTHFEDEMGKTQWKHYYLTSKIGEHPIKLQESTEGVDILHEIQNYEQQIWLIKQGLDFYTEIY